MLERRGRIGDDSGLQGAVLESDAYVAVGRVDVCPGILLERQRWRSRRRTRGQCHVRPWRARKDRLEIFAPVAARTIPEQVEHGVHQTMAELRVVEALEHRNCKS